MSINCAIGHAAVDKLSEQAMLVQNDFCNDDPAVSPDGRFVIIRSGGDESRDASAPTLVVVQHWAEELKRLVPAK